MQSKSAIARIRDRISTMRRSLRYVTFALAACCPDCGDLSTMIRDMGFQEITPPSTISGPGSVIYIKQEHPLRTALICATRHSLGAGFVPSEYDTRQSQFSKTTKRHFALSADVLSQVKADTSLHSISNVNVTITNPKIYIVTDTDVFENIQYRSQVCKDSIRRRVAAKFKVSMISETLEGDVSYCVTWDTGAHLSAEAKLDLLTNLRAKLKLGNATIRGNCITGHALVWGIVDDRWLAQAAAEDVVMSSGYSVELNSLEGDVDVTHTDLQMDLAPLPTSHNESELLQ